jgi:molybdate transport system substrate-binding protein
VLGAGASKGIVQAVQEEFLAATGAEVRGIFGAVSAIKERLNSGEACDVIILTAPMLHELKAQERLLAGTTAASDTWRPALRCARARRCRGSMKTTNSPRA